MFSRILQLQNCSVETSPDFHHHCVDVVFLLCVVLSSQVGATTRKVAEKMCYISCRVDKCKHRFTSQKLSVVSFFPSLSLKYCKQPSAWRSNAPSELLYGGHVGPTFWRTWTHQSWNDGRRDHYRSTWMQHENKNTDFSFWVNLLIRRTKVKY